MKQNSVKSWGGEERERACMVMMAVAAVCVCPFTGRRCVCVCVCVCWSLMTHESSSRKRGFALEGKSEVPRVQAAAFRKEGRPGGVQGEGTGNLALLSWLSLVVVDWRKGLPGRRPAE